MMRDDGKPIYLIRILLGMVYCDGIHCAERNRGAASINRGRSWQGH